MAQLRWQPVAAPNPGSLRDVMLAGQNISGSFDKLGSMLRDREAALRTRATDEQAAQVLLAKDQAGLDAAAAAALGTGNRRVNQRAIAELVSGQRGVLQDRFIKGDEIAGIRGRNSVAGLIPELSQQYYGGNVAEALAAQRAAIANDTTGFAARGFQDFSDEFMSYQDQGVGRRETADNNDANQDDARRRTGLLASAEARRARADQEARQDKQLRERAEREAVLIARNSDPSLTNQEVLQRYRQNNPALWEENPTFARMLEDSVASTRDHFLTPTEGQTAAGNALGASALVDTNVASTALSNLAAESSLAVAAQQRAGAHQDATADSVVDRLSEQMPRGAAARRVRQALAAGIPLSVQAGFLDARPVEDRHWLTGGVLDAERQWDAAMERIQQERTDGDDTRTEAALAKQLAPLKEIESKITTLRSRALREQASGRYGRDQASPATLAALEKAAQEAATLRAAAVYGQVAPTIDP